MRHQRFIFAAAILLVLPGASARAQQQPGISGGRYTLAAIDGHALPYAPTEPGRPPEAGTLEILCSSLIVKPDGHFRMAMTYRATRAGQTQLFDNPFTGTIEKGADGWIMKWDDAGITPVKLEGDSLSMQNEGQWYTFRRPGPPRAGS